MKRGLDVTLSKSKEGPLAVKSMRVDARSPNKKVSDLERFQCGAFEIGGAKLPKETKQCKTGAQAERGWHASASASASAPTHFFSLCPQIPITITPLKK